MKKDELKDLILTDPILERYFDIDGSKSIEKDEYDWFVSKAEKYISKFENPESYFHVQENNKEIGTYSFKQIVSDFYERNIYLSLEGDNAWLPFSLLERIYREGIDDEAQGGERDSTGIEKEPLWFNRNELLIFNSSQQKLHYSGVIKDPAKGIALARVTNDTNYANSILFLTIVPSSNYSARKKHRRLLTARVLIDDGSDRPCIEVIVDPGLLKFGHYNVYDRRNIVLQSILIGRIKKSYFHGIFNGKIIIDSKSAHIIVKKKQGVFHFQKASKCIAKMSRLKIPFIDALIENKRCYGLEFLESPSDEERMLIISYIISIDIKFWIHYRY